MITEHRTLTVIIRDDSPLIHAGDSPSYRSVRIQLSGEQLKAISNLDKNEHISRSFFEPESFYTTSDKL